MAGLLVSGEERIYPRDFKNEVRGCLDIDHLLERAVVLLNEEQSCIEGILTNMVTEMASRSRPEYFDMVLIKKELLSFSEQGARFAKRMQAFDNTSEGLFVRQNWTAIFGSVDGLRHRHVGITRLTQPTNLGEGMEETTLVIIVLAPLKDKSTKSAKETARTFASLLMDDMLRIELEHAPDEESTKDILRTAATINSTCEATSRLAFLSDGPKMKARCRPPGTGIRQDFARRWACYKSDWLDGIKDPQSANKSLSTVFFLICTILPTSIAYGMLNDANTSGLINVQKVILGQAIGGIFFAFFGGQPMLILSTTAPLSIYIHVIYNIAYHTQWPFYNLYVCVGLWAQLFLVLAALFHAASLLKYTKRSTEEMFSLFIAAALTYKAVRAMVETYTASYTACFNATSSPSDSISTGCLPQAALLFISLTLLTFWMSTTLDNFRNTPFLTRILRNVLSDYAVPLAMVVFALISHFLFFNVPKATFNTYATADVLFRPFWQLPLEAHAVAFGLAIPLATLFFVDQLLVTKTVDNRQNKLRKGPAHHWDLLVVAILNVFLSLACLPWMHAALPSAFLHLRSLADIEERVHDGRLQQVIVNPREARPAALVAHVLIVFIYVFALQFISDHVPSALFQGLFLFMALSSLGPNQLWHRILLFVTEQRAYPPTSYIRRVPQRAVHCFTLLQLVQLALLLVIGLSPLYYISMLFPIVIALFVPIRLFLLPVLFCPEHLEVIDGSH